MIKEAVFDTGPLFHLSEIEETKLLETVERKLVTGQVLNELNPEVKEVDLERMKLDGSSKDNSKYLVQKHGLDLGESTAISLCHQEDVEIFFTDDLEARKTAKSQGLEAHGSLAILTRALKEGIINKEEALEIIDQLYRDSSLYITKDLINWTKKKIRDY